MAGVLCTLCILFSLHGVGGIEDDTNNPYTYKILYILISYKYYTK